MTLTLPDERTRAVRKARRFLIRLLNPKLTPKVPRAVREEAAAILKHFPWHSDIIRMVTEMPDTFGKLEKHEMLSLRLGSEIYNIDKIVTDAKIRKYKKNDKEN